MSIFANTLILLIDKVIERINEKRDVSKLIERYAEGENRGLVIRITNNNGTEMVALITLIFFQNKLIKTEYSNICSYNLRRVIHVQTTEDVFLGLCALEYRPIDAWRTINKYTGRRAIEFKIPEGENNWLVDIPLLNGLFEDLEEIIREFKLRDIILGGG